jgi:hypothetical protein
MRPNLPAVLSFVVVAAFASLGADEAQPRRAVPGRPLILRPVRHGVSRPVRDMPKLRPEDLIGEHEHPVLKIPRHYGSRPLFLRDAAVQESVPSLKALDAVPGLAFDGLGTTTGYGVQYAPPDTNGAVGSTQYVQWVNVAFSVYSKSDGHRLAGPTAGGHLFTSIGGPCATTNDGDPIAIYDKLADRWVLTQFALPNFPNGPFFQCIAVSKTSDATGQYNVYSYSFPDLNDYPKVGVWPDGYYVTYNIFHWNGSFFSFVGGEACAYNRAAMLAGTAATSICFIDSTHGGFLPSDVDGTTPPPVGEPNFSLGFDDNRQDLDLWKFHVDFATPANSTFTDAPARIPVSSFFPASSVPQLGTGTFLDPLSDRMMYRLAYRNFGSHESLVANHSVDVSGRSALRWYEIQDPNGSGGGPTVVQEGTFAPDTNDRWMGSIAMDHYGNMLLGYSRAGTAIHPQIFVTGRSASDPPGQMQPELLVKAGAGSQNGGLSRWGDYSAMTVDPVDDITFWYTTEFIPSNGLFNWATHIASFAFPLPPALALAAPSSLTVAQGTSGSAPVTVSSLRGFSGDTTLTASTAPSGVTLDFTPNPVTLPANGSVGSTLGVTADTNATLGPAALTLTGTSGTTVGSLPFALTISGFQVTAPATLVAYQGGGAAATINVDSLFGFTDATSLSVTGLPAGVTGGLSPATVTPPPSGHGPSTLLLAASPSATGTATLTVSGVSNGVTRSADIGLSIVPGFFAEGAESAASPMRLTASNLSQTAWFRTSSTSNSGSFAWQVGVPPGGVYSSLADARLTTPPLDLSGATTAGLSYRYKYQTRRNRDFLEVRASADGGRTWRVLSRASGSSPQFPGNWALGAASLDAFAGGSRVLVQFRFTSEVGAVGFGALIDDILVGKN